MHWPHWVPQHTDLCHKVLICIFSLKCTDAFLLCGNFRIQSLSRCHHASRIFHGCVDIVLFFFFLSGGKCRDLARVTKNHHYVVHGLYFDPMTPPFLGVLKSQSRTSARPGSIPSWVSYSTPAPFWRLYMQYTQLGSLPWGTKGSPRADSWTFCLYWQKAVGPGIKTHHPPPQLKSNV